MTNVQDLLKQAGASFSDAVMLHVYLAEEGHFREMDSVLGEFLTEPYPARTTVYTRLPPDFLRRDRGFGCLRITLPSGARRSPQSASRLRCGGGGVVRAFRGAAGQPDPTRRHWAAGHLCRRASLIPISPASSDHLHCRRGVPYPIDPRGPIPAPLSTPQVETLAHRGLG
ncbi:MAG TPA: RidA family protein [Pseudonocardiaceae bacterium]|nr:RidA family protein [Pseudonocardiaceae bacterium]